MGLIRSSLRQDCLDLVDHERQVWSGEAQARGRNTVVFDVEKSATVGVFAQGCDSDRDASQLASVSQTSAIALGLLSNLGYGG